MQSCTLRFREHGGNGIREPDKAINGGDQDVLNPPVLQFHHDAEPELGAFVLGNPEPQELFLALHVDGQGKIDRLVAHPAVLAALDDNAVEVDDRIDGIKRPALPCPNIVQHSIGYAADQGFGDLDLVELQQHGLHIPDAHASGIHGQNFFIESLEALLALWDELRFKGAVPISGRANIELIVIDDDGFAPGAVELQGKNGRLKKPKTSIDNNCVNTLLEKDIPRSNASASGYKRRGYTQTGASAAPPCFGSFSRKSIRTSGS